MKSKDLKKSSGSKCSVSGRAMVPLKIFLGKKCAGFNGTWLESLHSTRLRQKDRIYI